MVTPSNRTTREDVTCENNHQLTYVHFFARGQKDTPCSKCDVSSDPNMENGVAQKNEAWVCMPCLFYVCMKCATPTGAVAHKLYMSGTWADWLGEIKVQYLQDIFNYGSESREDYSWQDEKCGFNVRVKYDATVITLPNHNKPTSYGCKTTFVLTDDDEPRWNSLQ